VFKSKITYTAETECLKVPLHTQQKQGAENYNYIHSRNRVFKRSITYVAETGCYKVQLHIQQERGV